ncbi:MAG: 16S rRNA (cytosine(1402)-N(4))-methyltransferase RsmH [Oscillospiraceae bacterium]
MENENQEHKRRPRYKGTHPQKYEEKYKELDPLKYAEQVSKIIERGATPAGMHIPICVNEILELLQIKEGERGLDATLGYGGHSQKMLEKLHGTGHLYALDVDPLEIKKTEERLRNLGYGRDALTVIESNFARIDEISQESGKFDFFLADLGVSSMQIDNPERGFSYKAQGPLDLRLNPLKGQSAANMLQSVSYMDLCSMLSENADEPYAEKIAKAIVVKIRNSGRIETTTELRQVIEGALESIPLGEKERREEVKKSCQRTFQAIRIDINHEFEVLEELLQKLPTVLNSGGRAAILTFHSGEDRLVKKSFKALLNEGVYSDVARDVIRPTSEECFNNSRAKSAKLRWAIKA